MDEKIGLACDHGGFKLKEGLKRYLSRKGYAVEDFGSQNKKPCDYPLFGYKAARAVSKGKFKKAILICKTGIGMAIIANKLPNVRSGVCATVAQAKSAREHNDTNVLSLAAKYTGLKKAKRIVNTWLVTDALGGRHGRRVNQIKRLEKK